MAQPSQSKAQLYMGKFSSLQSTSPTAESWSFGIALSPLVKGCMRRLVRENRKRASVEEALNDAQSNLVTLFKRKGRETGKTNLT